MRLNGKVFLVLTLCLAFVTLVPEPKQNGFECSDQSIRGPFIALQISLTQLLICCIFAPILSVIIIENLLRNGNEVSVKSHIKRVTIALLFGLMINFLAVMSAKNLFGRLRPHTIEFCNAHHYCSRDSSEKYIESFECRNPEYSVHMQKNVRHSFYSGHASLGLYSGVFLVLYLRTKLQFHSILLNYLMSLIYLSIILVSLYPGFTQFKNYWHFSSDVLTGYIIGLLTAVITFRVFASDSQTEQKRLNSNYKPLNQLLTTAFLAIH